MNLLIPISDSGKSSVEMSQRPVPMCLEPVANLGAAAAQRAYSASMTAGTAVVSGATAAAKVGGPMIEAAANKVMEVTQSGINVTGQVLKHRGTKTAVTLATAATAAAVGVPLVTTAVINYVGFTGAGVGAGTFAAGIQSGIGNVVAGSTYAYMQSLGATGGVAILGPVGISAGALGLATAGVLQYRNSGPLQQLQPAFEAFAVESRIYLYKHGHQLRSHL